MVNQDKEALLKILQLNSNCVPVGDIRVKTRCILCGDSLKDANKKRLYIVCDPYDKDAVKYICFNCGEYGMLTGDMLAQIIGDDYEAIQLLKRINKTATMDSGNNKINKYKNNREIQLSVPVPKKQINTINKIKYINNRIGYAIPIEDYQKLKFVFNISEFIIENSIPVSDTDRNLLPLYDRDYIGFLSVKNEYLVLRDITGKNKRRYVKYNLFHMSSNAHSFYTVQNQVDTITTEPIEIVAAEGPVDILSIIYNIYGGIKPNIVFMSTNHGAFYNPLLYYINKGLVGSNVYINIYKDSDSIMNYELLKKQMQIYTKHFRVYGNSIGKDFGVPPDKFNREIVL